MTADTRVLRLSSGLGTSWIHHSAVVSTNIRPSGFWVVVVVVCMSLHVLPWLCGFLSRCWDWLQLPATMHRKNNSDKSLVYHYVISITLMSNEAVNPGFYLHCLFSSYVHIHTWLSSEAKWKRFCFSSWLLWSTYAFVWVTAPSTWMD